MKTSPLLLALILWVQCLFMMGAVVGGGGGVGITGWPSSSSAREVTWANSLANAMKVGDGVNPMCFYTDATFNAPVARPCSDTDIRALIPASHSWSLYSVGSSAIVWTVTPGAASKYLMYLFGSNYHPVKTIYFDAGSINVDGSNCTSPTETSLNFSEKTWVIGCGDSNSSVLSGKVRMPASWDGSTVVFTLSLFHGTTESITFAGDFSARCRGAGDTIDSTYGTAQSADVAITTANKIAEATTTDVTPNGSCAGGQFLGWRYVVDASNFSTNAANAKVLGVSIRYGVGSLSD